MPIFIKTKLKISDDQTQIDKYRLAANITEYHIISKLILQRIIIKNFCMSFEGQYQIWNPNRISKSERNLVDSFYCQNPVKIILTLFYEKCIKHRQR